MDSKTDQVVILKINEEFCPVVNPGSQRFGDFMVGSYKIHFRDYRSLSALIETINEYFDFIYENPSVMIALLQRFVPIEIAAQIVSDIMMQEAAREDLILSEIC